MAGTDLAENRPGSGPEGLLMCNGHGKATLNRKQLRPVLDLRRHIAGDPDTGEMPAKRRGVAENASEGKGAYGHSRGSGGGWEDL